MNKKSGTAVEIGEFLVERLKSVDKTLSCIGMTLNVGEDSKGNHVYRIERGKENTVTKVVDIVTEGANGTLFDLMLIDATVLRFHGEDDLVERKMQSHSNAIMVMELVADNMLKMFMLVVSRAIKDAGTVRRMAMVSEDITASLIDAVKSTEKMQRERRDLVAAMEAFRPQPN